MRRTQTGHISRIPTNVRLIPCPIDGWFVRLAATDLILVSHRFTATQLQSRIAAVEQRIQQAERRRGGRALDDIEVSCVPT